MKDLNGIEYDIYDFMSYAYGKKIVIFGAGKYGNHIYETLMNKGISVSAVCDNNKERLDSLKDKYPVSSLENLKNAVEEYYFIIAIAKIETVKIIRSQLCQYGVRPDRLIIPLPDIKTGYFDSLIMFDSEYCVQAVKEHWKRARHCGAQIADYFETNDLYRLIVFETDELKGRLDQDLLNSRVVIKKKIHALEEFTEKEECDAVVVLDEENYEVIEERLMQKTEKPIISIWDVVRF